MISGFIYSTYHDETNQKNYMLLNDLENSFNIKNYTNFIKTTQNLQVTINEVSTENIVVSKYQFENENIKVFKYEK